MIPSISPCRAAAPLKILKLKTRKKIWLNHCFFNCDWINKPSWRFSHFPEREKSKRFNKFWKWFCWFPFKADFDGFEKKSGYYFVWHCDSFNRLFPTVFRVNANKKQLVSILLEKKRKKISKIFRVHWERESEWDIKIENQQASGQHSVIVKTDFIIWSITFDMHALLDIVALVEHLLYWSV